MTASAGTLFLASSSMPRWAVRSSMASAESSPAARFFSPFSVGGVQASVWFRGFSVTAVRLERVASRSQLLARSRGPKVLDEVVENLLLERGEADRHAPEFCGRKARCKAGYDPPSD